MNKDKPSFLYNMKSDWAFYLKKSDLQLNIS